jgi:hypothetical protein
VKQLREAGKSRNFIEELYGPQFEVLRFLKNRSPWFALHEMDKLREMKNVSFAVVHHTQPFQELVALYERNQLTGEEFLIRLPGGSEGARPVHVGLPTHRTAD